LRLSCTGTRVPCDAQVVRNEGTVDEGQVNWAAESR
jgi:hypothetical protein